MTTLLIVRILAWLKPLEKRIFQQPKLHTVQLVIGRDVSLFDIEAAIKASDIGLKHIVIKQGKTPQVQRVEVILEGATQTDLLPLLESLRSIAGVHEASYATS